MQLFLKKMQWLAGMDFDQLMGVTSLARHHEL